MNSRTAVAQGQLQSIVTRIERLEEEKKAIADDIKEVYAEAKANGFCTKTLRKVIALRKKDRAEREEEEAMLDLYLNALGMTPLEEMIRDGRASVSSIDSDGNETVIAGRGQGDSQTAQAAT